MRQNASCPIYLRPDYLRTVYLLGSADTGQSAAITLSADGRVHGTKDYARYGFQDDRLYLLDQAGQKRARLRHHPEANGFFPDDATALYMVPLLTLDPPPPPVGNARLLVNTIPKSGTYLLDLVLARIGYHGLGLHLIPRECHDNRGVALDIIHRAPFSRRIFAPASAVTRIMAPGEYTVGHVASGAELTAIASTGVGIIQCQRDLREVLVSLYRFKRKSVDPVSSADRLWRHLNGPDGFLAFLCTYAEGELTDLRDFTQLMPQLPGVLLRFEDLIAGVIPPASRTALDHLDEDLGEMMAAILPDCLGHDSSTLTAARTDWRAHWSKAAEEFFERSGLLAANRGLGYQ